MTAFDSFPWGSLLITILDRADHLRADEANY